MGRETAESLCFRLQSATRFFSRARLKVYSAALRRGSPKTDIDLNIGLWKHRSINIDETRFSESGSMAIP
jgi:hypothetical protein